MFSATRIRKTANTRFNGFGSIAWASLTPSGAVISVMAMTMAKVGRFTAPTVSGGLLGAASTSRNPMTEGTAISTPNPAAVATARWIGTLNRLISGTPKLPPPIPISTDRNPTEGDSAARAALSPSVGFLSVLMGIGGGSFGVPLMSLFNVPIHRAVATAAGFGVLIAVPSVIGFLLVDAAPNSPPLTVGAVNLPTFAIVIAMTLITAPLGVRLAHAMDPKPLKRVFAVFLILVALNMLRKSLGL